MRICILGIMLFSFGLHAEETLLGCTDTKAKTYSNNITTLDKTMYSIVLKDIDKDQDAVAYADGWDGVVVHNDLTEYYKLDDSETIIGWMKPFIRELNIFLDFHTLNRLTGEHTTINYYKPRELINYDPIKERADLYKTETYTAIAEEVSRCKVMEKLF